MARVLRVTEFAALKIGNVDSRVGCAFVSNRGKGGGMRNAMLSPDCLTLLRTCGSGSPPGRDVSAWLCWLFSGAIIRSASASPTLPRGWVSRCSRGRSISGPCGAAGHRGDGQQGPGTPDAPCAAPTGPPQHRTEDSAESGRRSPDTRVPQKTEKRDGYKRQTNDEGGGGEGREERMARGDPRPVSPPRQKPSLVVQCAIPYQRQVLCADEEPTRSPRARWP